MSNRIKFTVVKQQKFVYTKIKQISSKGNFTMTFNQVFYCPHCKKNIYKSKFFIYKIGTPIRICEYCNKEYNHPYTYEWSILSVFHKFFYCFLSNGRWFFLFSAFIEFTCKDYLTALNWAIAWLLVSILPLIIFDSKKIKESYERTKNNPEYIQKLSDLGCTNIAIRIDPYYK